jgi:hypothetical protein
MFQWMILPVAVTTLKLLRQKHSVVTSFYQLFLSLPTFALLFKPEFMPLGLQLPPDPYITSLYLQD